MALLHVAAFGMGYVLSKVVGFNEKTARTVSIETGLACVIAPHCWFLGLPCVCALALK